MRNKIVLFFLCALPLACVDDSTPAASTTPAAPVVARANVVVSATVGAPLNFDATQGGTVFTNPAQAGMTYTIAFVDPRNGLSATGGVITGVPAAPGVIRVTLNGTDGLGRTVSDPFAIVAFANGLLTPTLPTPSAQYADAEVPLPAIFKTNIYGATVAATDNTPTVNPITDAGATLGRVLFYDPRLSANDVLSCASCHTQSLGFSDDPAFSAGFAGGLTGRHTPALANARFYQNGRFFWDERAATLEDQVVGPIQSAVEMGMTLDALVLKLMATTYYRPLFAAAFGTPVITSDRIALALAQFTRSLVSAKSRYDRAFSAAGVPNFALTLTPQEQAGEQLFRDLGCASCHTTIAQVSDGVHNIGLDATITDIGAGGGAFKAPSLRNVAVRPRYMHDGRFTSLADVVDFFDAGVKANPSLDARLKAGDGTPKRLGLTATQKLALVAFMKTLTDSTFLTDPRFSDPFVEPTAPPPPPQQPGLTPFNITIQGRAYHPATLTVPPSATLNFTNLDNTRHSAKFASPLITSTPIFSSGSKSVVMPSTPGTYAYQCAVHGAQMSGTIIVR